MRGYDTSLDRHCAVKVLAPELATSAAARKRFSREAKSAAAVVHCHVVPIQNVDEHDGLPYLVMPVVEGKSLQQRVESDGPLSVIETVRIAMQVAEGLAAAHSQGLVHRDIKPANILLKNGVERVQITDFGLARAVDDASMTRSGVIAGTPQYMSPEQAHGDEIDHRSDLFSLGSVMYFMLTGRSPFRAETTMGVLNRIGNDEPRRLQAINPEIPVWLAGIVTKLLSKSPADRFGTAQETAELLEDCLAHVQQPTTTPLPESIAALAPQRNRRPPIGKYIVAAVFGFSLIFAGVLVILEMNKGTLTIESEADDIPIRIMQDDDVIERLTVSKSGKATRIAAGNYVVELDGHFEGLEVSNGTIALNRGGDTTVKITHQQRASQKSTVQDKALIGSWRVMDGPEEVEPGYELDCDKMMTFDEGRGSYQTEDETPIQFSYRVLPEKMIRLTVINGASTGSARESLYRYNLPDPNHLDLQPYVEGKPTPEKMTLVRMGEAEELSTHASLTVPVDTSDTYGWADHDFVDYHRMLIESESFLGSLTWPSEIDLIPTGKDKSTEWLKKHLDVKTLKTNVIELGMHGHVRNKVQRDQILAKVAEAYRNRIADTKTDAGQETIQRLRKSHSDVVKERDLATANHSRLLKDAPTDTGELAASLDELVRLNELLTVLCYRLIEYGVPAIAGSTESSLRGKAIGAKAGKGASDRDLDRLLADAIRQFNDHQRVDPVGSKQPLLTDDEVIAAVRDLSHELESLDISESDYQVLRDAIQRGKIPNHWTIESSNRFKLSDGRIGERWGGQLTMRRDDHSQRTYVFRSRYVGIEPETPASTQPLLAGHVSLTDWIAKVNEAEPAIYSPLPDLPVTEQEIIAALSDLVDKKQSANFESERRTLQQMIDTRSFPPDAELTLFRPQRHRTNGSRWSNRDGFESSKWTLHLRYPYIKGDEKIITADIIGQRTITSMPVDRVADEEIQWGPPAADGLQFGVAVEVSDSDDISDSFSGVVALYTPHFYLRNPRVEETEFVQLPRLYQHYDVDARTATGEQLPTKQRQGYYGISTINLPDQLNRRWRIYKPASSSLVGNYTPTFFEESLSLEPPDGRFFDTFPAVAVNAPLNTPLRVRISIPHPLLSDSTDMMSGEIRLPGLSVASPLAAASEENVGKNEKKGSETMVTEVDGEWHMVEACDTKGVSLEVRPHNRTYQGDRCTAAWAGGGHECRIQVNPDAKTIWSFIKDEDHSFFVDDYELQGGKLILTNDTGTGKRRAVYERGHVRIPDVVPEVAEQQVARWRSAVVEIMVTGTQEGTVDEPHSVGFGVVVRKDGTLVLHINSKWGDIDKEQANINAKFDDGSQVPLELVAGNSSVLVLRPKDPVALNHHFPFSLGPTEVDDEVYVGQLTLPSTDADATHNLVATKVQLAQADRRIATMNSPVWQLKAVQRIPNSHCLPVLSGDGELLAITMTNTGGLLLAIPTARLIEMFPEPFAPAETEKVSAVDQRERDSNNKESPQLPHTISVSEDADKKIPVDLSSKGVDVPPMAFDTLEDFLKPGNDLFDKQMLEIDKRLAKAEKGSAEHALFTTKKKQLKEQWDLSVAQVKGMVAAAEAGNPVQLAPIVIPNNPSPWRAPLPDPLQKHDEEIARVLAGTWDIKRDTGLEEELDGTEVAIEELTAMFSKNMLIVHLKIGDEQHEMHYMYRISGDKIDLWGYDPINKQTDRDHPMLGSYSLENDTLRICHHDQEMEVGQPQARPPVHPGKGLVYWELQRRN
ncbi:serine/threonine protein kinase [Neorhodopirellula pilleata]|nr:serine/threonine-protein kinase [Neorhodopirellula pilleata]